MDDRNINNGCISCLSVTSLIVAIASGAISVIQFFFSDADSFLETFSKLFNKFLPAISLLLDNFDSTIKQFVGLHPATAQASAIFIIIISGLISFYVRENIFFGYLNTCEWTRFVLLISPLAFVWIWSFYGSVSTFNIILFVLGFIISVFIIPIFKIIIALIDLIGYLIEYLKQRNR